jgi:RNA polymerase sigma-70 factor (ECF subfamily)
MRLRTDAPDGHSDLSDFGLAQLLAVDDEDAWRLFHAKYDRLIYSCIGRVLARFPAVVSKDDVEEIYAEVLYQLLRRDRRKLRAYSPDRGTRLGTWIGLISMNAAHDHLRKIRRSPTTQGDAGEAALVPDPGPGPYERALAREGWSAIREVMGSLSAKDREFVSLYFVEGLGPEEVARRMRISVKTVYSKKHKVRRRLETMLDAPAMAA